ncbi:MAG: T9SS type A sorting domain-containing protein [Flavobacteriales bacterium]|nr:T9SS type A sorting domain-containing protein [Flavobacteriales bacterium]
MVLTYLNLNYLTKQINLENNAKGIYFLEIETDEGIINKKLILQ